MKKVRVLVDVDGVIVDSVKKMLSKVNSRFETKYTHDDIVIWSFFGGPGKVNPDSFMPIEHQLYIHEIMEEPGFAGDMEFIEEAREALSFYKDYGCDIVLLTAPWSKSKTWQEDRTGHLQPHLGHIYSEIIYSWDKENTPGDILLDDNPAFIEKWAAKHLGSKGLIFDQPWNRNHTGFERIKGWKDRRLAEIIVSKRFLG